ncbi:rhodanese-like domain-containing protein [Thioclava pacifica]|uniref:Rhodanese domain-containing protein n=1 Tax=Thioclava pacifica DSM 10166 TaxID=1353537 RepID=A0A074JHY5_9RHOB|nr:rhodanese-like domain-containing protein [Thioclava pacifica]KEO56089.1 hypothetical protein TP2_00790 [Thioclava pacifica DSM 10166]
MLSSSLRAILAVMALAPAAFAEVTDVPANKQTKAGLYLSAPDAARMLEDPGVLFLDVRSRPELTFLGLPSRIDVNIPVMTMPQDAAYDPSLQSYRMISNPDFEFSFLDYAEAAGIEDETPIVILCRSGTRSAKAANMLYDLGYENVYTIIDGFEGDVAQDGIERGHRALNGWKNAGLEWSYQLPPEKVYPGDR